MAENLEREDCQQPLNRWGMLVVLSVHEHHWGIHLSLNETALEKLTSEATGISVSSIQRFKKEAREGSVSSPPTKRPRISPVVDSMDAFDIGCLRRTVASFYEEGEVPNLDKKN
ncbi:hypothetical protein Pcinc_011873 [Petrolisthes cinctipes]|uniref:Uncharacterized protein n=1 Tax=Petrolisthes cinctipes TaxID=88211 RepID=A0AAE1KVX7_PETCI|nr:hypothetical protein Pcinc_011873 [Petrolisthes cinctipes]